MKGAQVKCKCHWCSFACSTLTRVPRVLVLFYVYGFMCRKWNKMWIHSFDFESFIDSWVSLLFYFYQVKLDMEINFSHLPSSFKFHSNWLGVIYSGANFNGFYFQLKNSNLSFTQFFWPHWTQLHVQFGTTFNEQTLWSYP